MRIRALRVLVVCLCFGISCLAATPGLAAGPKQYVWGTGPMGGPWRIGIGAAFQVLNETLKGQYAFTGAASGGLIENVRRMVEGEYHTI